VKADRHLLLHICRMPAAGMLHFRYSFEHRRSFRGFHKKAGPVEDALDPSECQAAGPRWVRAVEER